MKVTTPQRREKISFTPWKILLSTLAQYIPMDKIEKRKPQTSKTYNLKFGIRIYEVFLNK
tara:strand:- start:56 stop:235 length:180 start_codon:yes stop_codon:yes gene_type:complete